MKKIIALLLAAAIMTGVCCFEVSAVPDPDYMPEPTETYTAANDKIYETNYCYTNAQENDELIVCVYYEPDGLTFEEVHQIVYERTGWTHNDLLEYSYRDFVNYEGEDITEAEKLEIKEKINNYVIIEREVYNEAKESNAKPFFDYMDLDFEYISSSVIKYREEPVSIDYSAVIMCLSKSEINKAYQMDYVTKIDCFRRKDGAPSTLPKLPDKIDLREYCLNQMEFFAFADDQLLVADIDLNSEDYDLFFDEMGILPEKVGKTLIYNDFYALTNGKNIKMCLTKAQIYKAAELSCIDRIKVSPNPEIYTIIACTKGDVNGDRSLDITDAVDIQKYAVDKTEFSEKQKDLGDYNLDNNCDVLDANAIQVALVFE